MARRHTGAYYSAPTLTEAMKMAEKASPTFRVRSFKRTPKGWSVKVEPYARTLNHTMNQLLDNLTLSGV